MCNVFAVAKKLCEARNWNVSNLELQKMLYISQVLHLGMFNHHLFRGGFEAWDYGPVIPEVYHRFKIFGNNSIQEWSFPKIDEECTKDEVDFITAVSNLLSELKAFQLVALTHRKGSAWESVYVPGAHDISIPEDKMKQEYNDIWKKRDA